MRAGHGRLRNQCSGGLNPRASRRLEMNIVVACRSRRLFFWRSADRLVDRFGNEVRVPDIAVLDASVPQHHFLVVREIGDGHDDFAKGLRRDVRPRIAKSQDNCSTHLVMGLRIQEQGLDQRRRKAFGLGQGLR
jgi:hypothetical protein